MDFKWYTPLTVIGGLSVGSVLLPALFLLFLPLLLPILVWQFLTT